MQNLLALFNPQGNFSPYRELWAKTGGLPFLYPHIRKYAIDGKNSLSDVFPLETSEKGCRLRTTVNSPQVI